MRTIAISALLSLAAVACGTVPEPTSTGSAALGCGGAEPCDPAALLPCGAPAEGCACLDQDNIDHCPDGMVPWCCEQLPGRPPEECNAPADICEHQAPTTSDPRTGKWCCKNLCPAPITCREAPPNTPVCSSGQRCDEYDPLYPLCAAGSYCNYDCTDIDGCLHGTCVVGSPDAGCP